MKTTTQTAIHPNTDQEYEIELPAHDVVREAILTLDFPLEGIKVKETAEKLTVHFNLSEKDKNALKKSGRRYLNLFRYNLVAPAFKYLLEKGKLIQPNGRGKPYFLASEPTTLFPDQPIKPPREDSIEVIYKKMQESLASELLDEIKKKKPVFFEELVIDLLVAMGYGGSREDAEAVGRSGDGGIDGIINEDRLGLDIVYVQAKRWEANIGEPPVRDFVGALDGKGAQKGIFITTSEFIPSAEKYAERSSKNIVLIDGQQLAQFMIDNDVGVSTTKTYDIKRVDSDYFAEEE